MSDMFHDVKLKKSHLYIESNNKNKSDKYDIPYYVSDRKDFTCSNPAVLLEICGS